jgi:hypothetical protein
VLPHEWIERSVRCSRSRVARLIENLGHALLESIGPPIGADQAPGFSELDGSKLLGCD